MVKSKASSLTCTFWLVMDITIASSLIGTVYPIIIMIHMLATWGWSTNQTTGNKPLTGPLRKRSRA